MESHTRNHDGEPSSLRFRVRTGNTYLGRHEPEFGWYVVDGWVPELRQRVMVDDVEREVVLVAELAATPAIAVMVVPDFNQPGCEPCAQADDPPTPEFCRLECPQYREGGRR